MIWFFVALGALLVLAVAFWAVGSAVGRLEGTVVPTVFEVDDAVDWVAECLPEEAAGQLTRDEVVLITRWWLDSFNQAGLASPFGKELGDEALTEDTGRQVAELDDAVDYVVAKALALDEPLDAVSVVVAVDLLGVYLAEMGAVDQAGEK